MVTPGSWWKNVKTGQRLVAPKYSSWLMTEDLRTSNNSGRYAKRCGLGRHPDLKPYYAEGPNQFLRWLSDEELRALHKSYRPDVDGRVPLPKWLTKPDFNDFLLDKDSGDPFWCGFYGARGSLVALVGLYEAKWYDNTTKTLKDAPLFNWGTERYTLTFIESSEVVKRLTPKYNRLRPTAWDKLDACPF